MKIAPIPGTVSRINSIQCIFRSTAAGPRTRNRGGFSSPTTPADPKPKTMPLVTSTGIEDFLEAPAFAGITV